MEKKGGITNITKLLKRGIIKNTQEGKIIKNFVIDCEGKNVALNELFQFSKIEFLKMED